MACVRPDGPLTLLATQAGALLVAPLDGVGIRQTPDGVVPARALWTAGGRTWQLTASRASSLPLADAVALSLRG